MRIATRVHHILLDKQNKQTAICKMCGKEIRRGNGYASRLRGSRSNRAGFICKKCIMGLDDLYWRSPRYIYQRRVPFGAPVTKEELHQIVEAK